jgi:hypothetical protein
MTDHELLLAIQKLLDGVEWDNDTFETIASLMHANGYTIHDIDDGARRAFNPL